MELSVKIKVVICIMTIALFGIAGLIGFATHQEIIRQKHVKATTFRVPVANGMIMYRGKVNRNRTQEAMIRATGRSRNFCDAEENVFSMPKGVGDEVEVFFFKPDGIWNIVEIEKEYEMRGLKPADPYSLAAVNERDPEFADEYGNFTIWKDSNGKWWGVSFFVRLGVRAVCIDKYDGDRSVYRGSPWFAGIRK